MNENKIIPVLTIECPEPSRKLVALGTVAIDGSWDVGSFAASMADLVSKLSEEALKRFPQAVGVYNMKWNHDGYYYGHTWYRGIGDVYAEKE